MKGNRNRKEQEAYERLMKQQAELKEKQAAQKTKESQGYVAAGKKSAYEAAQNSTGSRRQGWIQDRNGKNMPQPRKTKARETGTETYAGAGKGQSKAKGTPASPGKRDYTGTWVNTAGPGGGTEIWKLVALNPGETAADYYEKKRRKHEEEQKEIDAAFRRALEETQEELREQRLGVAEGFGRKKRYNRNYEDLFGLPEGGDFRSRVEGTRGWDKLNGSEQYDRMVYIEEELKKREKEREKEEKIGYNGGKEKEAALNGLFQAWDRRYAAERSGVQRPKDLVDRKPWSRPDVRNGVLPGQTGNEFTQEWIEKGAEKYDTVGALFEVGKRFGEGGSPERIRADLTSHPEAALPSGLNAERLTDLRIKQLNENFNKIDIKNKVLVNDITENREEIPLTTDLAKEQEQKESVKEKIDKVFGNEPGASFVVNVPFWIEKDWAGKIIAGHWAGGSGQDMNIDHDEDWSKYVKTDPSIATQTQHIVKQQCFGMHPGETRSIEFQGHTTFTAGDSLTGVNLLGGSNRDVGDYKVTGTVSMDQNGNLITDLECQFNDIVDPNMNYRPDKKRVDIVNSLPGMEPKAYSISISWSDQSVISADGENGTGWLGQKGLGTTEYLKTRMKGMQDMSGEEDEEVKWNELLNRILQGVV